MARRLSIDSSVGLGILAIAISLIALAVSLYEATLLNGQRRAEVWPYVEISTRYSGDGFRIEMNNRGVGPAIIRTMAVQVDGEPVEDFREAILSVLGPDDAFGYERFRTEALGPGVLEASGSRALFSVDWDEASRRLEAAWQDRLNIEACYCSVYGDCWTMELYNQPEPARHCPAS